MRERMLKMIWREEGANLVEYAVLIMLVIVVAAAGLTTLGTNLNTVFGNFASNITGGTF